jgi:drug/metabolite transporter (DMT)-like permease
MTNFIGETAALCTALCWSFGSVCFTISSRRIGHNVVNRLRLTIALILLPIAHLIIYGRLFSADATSYHLFWFGLSGLIGFVIGDRMLFKSFVLIGPRLGMLMMSTVPIFGIIIAWIFLHENLGLTDIIAIIITLSGISWVILQKKNGDHAKGHFPLGILLGIGAAFCQALGLILSKKGLVDNFSALSGNIIRVFVSVIIIWLFPLFKGEIPSTFKKLTDRKATLTLFGGAFLGPFLGVWFSLIAVQYAFVGIASTIMSLPPVLLIPLSYIVFKEKITLGSIFGTIVALTGVALIFLL